MALLPGPPLADEPQDPAEAPVTPPTTPMTGLEASRVMLMAEAPPPNSLEVNEYGAAAPKDELEASMALTGPEEQAPTPQAPSPEMQKLMERALEAMYGDSFPGLKPDATPQDWAQWGEDLWNRHSGAVSARLHLTRRNRLFRRGIQWISAVGFGPWREPPKPRDAARVVDNMIGPALDQRLQLITEQRPGFRTRPATSSPEDLKKAEADRKSVV